MKSQEYNNEANRIVAFNPNQSLKEIASSVLEPNEELIWTGNPKPKFSFIPLEVGSHDVAAGPSNIFFFGFAGMLFIAYKFYKTGSWASMALTLLLGTLLILGPDIIKHIRKKKTYYLLTNKRAFFKLWRRGSTKVYYLRFENVSRFQMEELKDKSGTLHFLPKKTFNFFTHDFIVGAKRHYPTFEGIDSVAKISAMLTECKRNLT